jgi:hypothetical protein
MMCVWWMALWRTGSSAARHRVRSHPGDAHQIVHVADALLFTPVLARTFRLQLAERTATPGNSKAYSFPICSVVGPKSCLQQRSQSLAANASLVFMLQY